MMYLKSILEQIKKKIPLSDKERQSICFLKSGIVKAKLAEELANLIGKISNKKVNIYIVRDDENMIMLRISDIDDNFLFSIRVNFDE